MATEERILEPEVMMSEDEVIAYDLLARKYLRILHAGFIETVINMSPGQGLFLDVGCGTGWVTIGVAKYNPLVEVVGIDLSEAMLQVAQRNAEQESVSARTKFLIGDAKLLAFEDQTFDSVFCHNMLHHLSDPLKMVKEMVRVVKKDGAVIIRDLVRHSKMITECHVNILGLPYNRLMKREYRNSIRAALSENEWKDLFREVNIPGAQFSKHFITHIGIQRPSGRKVQHYIEIPTPFYLKPLKSLYVS